MRAALSSVSALTSASTSPCHHRLLIGDPSFAKTLSRSRRKRSAFVYTMALQLTVEEVCVLPDTRPRLPRSGHMGVGPLPQGTGPWDGLILGGYTEAVGEGGPKRAEVWEVWGYNAAARAWQAVECADGPAPQGRLVGQAVVAGGAVWVIGGWAPSAGTKEQPELSFLDDVWRLDLASHTWSRVTPQGESLPRISRFQAVAVGDTIYIHHHRCDDHILALDTAADGGPRLSQVAVSGDVPPSRGLHSLTALPGKLVLFGGAPQHGPMMDDLHELDLETKVWSRVTPSGTPPAPRCAHVAAALPDGRHVLFWGGAQYKDQVAGGGGLQVLGDAFAYDAQARAWVDVQLAAGSAPLPAARNAMSLLPLRGGAGFLLHGGWVPFTSTFHDTHVLRISA